MPAQHSKMLFAENIWPVMHPTGYVARWVCLQFAIFFILFAGYTVSVPVVSSASDMVVPPITDTTLANGLRVIIVEKHTAPVVNITVGYKVGSKNETTDNTGFAHFFEHLMFEGSLNVPHGFFDRYCTEAGGNNNAYTTYDKTIYYMMLPANRLELGLWLESDRMMAFGVTRESVDIQRNVVLEEINQNVENRPYGTLSTVQNNLAYTRESSYSWDVYGDKSHIANAPYEKVQKFFDDYYRPDNACLVICGDVYPEQTLAIVHKYFSDIPGRKAPNASPVFKPTYRRGNTFQRVEDDIPMESLFLSYHFDGFTSADYYAAEILASVLSDGMSSRLYKTLVYEQQVASEINAYIDDRELSSLFMVYAIGNTTEHSCEQLNTAVQAVLAEVAHNGITQQELMKAQNRLSTRLAQYYQQVTNIADEVVHNALFFNEPQRAFRYIDMVNAVTTSDVRAFAEKLFNKANQIRVDFVPKAAAGAKK